MPPSRCTRLILRTLALLVLLNASSVHAAIIMVGPSGLIDTAIAATALQVAPPECAGLPLTNIILGTKDAGNVSSLILGTAGNDNLEGGGGDDCLVGGAGSDTINGNKAQGQGQGYKGKDVCIGSPSSTFINCFKIIIR